MADQPYTQDGTEREECSCLPGQPDSDCAQHGAYPHEAQCKATATMMGRTYRCERYRGHSEPMHYSLMGQLDMVQWPEGWQHD